MQRKGSHMRGEPIRVIGQNHVFIYLMDVRSNSIGVHWAKSGLWVIPLIKWQRNVYQGWSSGLCTAITLFSSFSQIHGYTFMQKLLHKKLTNVCIPNRHRTNLDVCGCLSRLAPALMKWTLLFDTDYAFVWLFIQLMSVQLSIIGYYFFQLMSIHFFIIGLLKRNKKGSCSHVHLNGWADV